jgi:hypothetical protein
MDIKMVNIEKLKTLHKHRNFLKIGVAALSTALTAGVYYGLYHFNMDFSGSAGFISISSTFTSLFLWASTLTDAHFVTNQITKKMYEHIKGNGLALFNKYVSEENLLTNENLETRKACMEIFEKIAFIDLVSYGFDSTDWREEKVPFLRLDNPKIQEIYKKEYGNKDIVGKQLIMILRHGDHYPQEMKLFLKLMQLQDNQFTQKDLIFIAKHFSRVESKAMMDFISQREIFTQLGETIQNIILTQKDNQHLDSDTREKLLNYYSKSEEVKLANTQVKEFKNNIEPKENEQYVIQENSFKTLLATKNIMKKVYDNHESMNNILEKIEALLTMKEKFMTYLDTKPNQYLEIQHFLKEDIDNTISNFNQEAQILNKMKSFSHDQLEEHKELVLHSVSERLRMLNTQMNIYKEKIENDLVDELGHSLEVNKKVLSAKMSA